jgi:hypothetical protein
MKSFEVDKKVLESKKVVHMDNFLTIDRNVLKNFCDQSCPADQQGNFLTFEIFLRFVKSSALGIPRAEHS